MFFDIQLNQSHFRASLLAILQACKKFLFASTNL
ncbi:hypothetical protein HPOKI102_02065 [Helicobacter pylori oki102]|nr:hypothetical protein HPOKI102_02065 [Helicobacter pylori oki102]